MALSTMFVLTRDINGYNGFGLPFCTDKYTAKLAGVAVSLTVPDNYKYWVAVFSIEPGVRVWVANNATAAVPAGATLAASNSELNPTARLVKANDVLSFVTPDTSADISVSFYALGNQP